MNLYIRHVRDDDIDALIELTLMAFEPIFKSFAKILGNEIYPILYPDWKATQTAVVENEIRNEDVMVWVGEIDGKVVGLITQKLDQESKMGEVRFLAVHPDVQNRGVGSALNKFVLEKMKKAGMSAAMVSTGGDPSHAPARRTYEKVGYIPLPFVNYYQKL